MRSGTPRYPVDRYLVESSNKIEMVNIIEDEIWNPEPVLRPEDEIILRKLHDMLQSTADDLKLLSGELSKFHEPGVQVKTQPTPLDEEFNEKVHIEELVNAKFHGFKIVDKASLPATLKKKDPVGFKSVVNYIEKPKINSELLVNKPVKNKNLEITRTKVLQIDEKIDEGTKSNKLNNGKVINTMAAVAYNEFTYKYVEPKVTTMEKKLHVQEMPSINIRGELKEQKVLQLDIIPDTKDIPENIVSKSNVAVIAVEHETTSLPKKVNKSVPPTVIYKQKQFKSDYIDQQTIRKIMRMSTCDSSGSANNVSSDTKHKLRTQKQIKTVIRTSPKNSVLTDRIKKISATASKEPEKRRRLNLDEWKKKLNAVYGQPSTSRNKKITSKLTVKKASAKKYNKTSDYICKPKTNIINNAEYIPYSQLTLGGVRVSDIEREISNIPNNHDIPLSPILDKILCSRENSFQNSSPRKDKNSDSQKFLNTSDEKLLEEVLDIERTVKKTVSKILKKNSHEAPYKTQNASSESNEASANSSYVDDFEDEKSDLTERSEKKLKLSSESEEKSSSTSEEKSKDGTDNDDDDDRPNLQTIQNTYTKTSNLSFKNSVDVYEFVHEIDTQDNATQSNATDKIIPKETQTSPRPTDRQNIQPIHNDLWPSIDPKGEVEKMFKLEKDFIKKLILDEYGDLIEKNINKPSTSKQNSQNENVTATQKNTQTSPAHVKCVMTSPTRTKTRTTSPFISLTVDHLTRPMIVVTNEEELDLEVDNDDLGISINLSSPRFSLRLPQTSKEILSNLDDCSRTPMKKDEKDNRSKSNRSIARETISSSSSTDGNNSSSEISSLGEVNLKLKRRLRKDRRVPTMSESSSTSTVSKYSSVSQSWGIIPLRSEGEISLGQTSRKVVSKASRSEGEASYGQTAKR